MLVFNGNYPLVGTFVDKEGVRIRLKYRILSDEGQFFTVNSTGLKDVGQELIIATPKKVSQGHMILDGIHYSIKKVRLLIPDRAIDSNLNRKINAEYVVELG